MDEETRNQIMNSTIAGVIITKDSKVTTMESGPRSPHFIVINLSVLIIILCCLISSSCSSGSIGYYIK